MGPQLKVRLAKALQKYQPAALRALDAQGERTEVAIRTTRRGGRWTQAIEVIAELQWVRLELVDSKGRLIHAIDNDGAPEGVEDLEPPRHGTAAREQALLALMLRAQDVALQRHTEALRPTLDAMRTMIRDLTEQAQGYRREALRQTEAAGNLAEQLMTIAERMATSDEERDDITKWLQLMPLVGKLLPSGPAPTPPPRAAPPSQARRPATPGPAAQAAAPPTSPKPGDRQEAPPASTK